MVLISLLTIPVVGEDNFLSFCESSEQIPRHPLTTEDFVYTRGYVDAFDGSHKGIDLATKTGNAIVAVWDGEVTIIKWDNDITGQRETGGVGFGYYLIVSNHHGSYSFYGHLLPNSVPLRVGAKVTAGMIVALSGNSGTSSGPHLHYAEKNLAGEWIDPTWVIHAAHRKYYPDYPEEKYPAFLQDHAGNQRASYCNELGEQGQVLLVNPANNNKQTPVKSIREIRIEDNNSLQQADNKDNTLLFEKFINHKKSSGTSSRHLKLWRPEGNIIKE